MATYEGVALDDADATPAGRSGGLSGTTYTAPVLVTGQGSSPAPYARGGSTTTAPVAVDVAGWLDGRTGADWTTTARTYEVADLAAWLAQVSGVRFAAREVRPTAVYRQGDRTTLVGYAVDAAGQPLRQVQVQFIGQTTQGLFAGAGSDLNGLVVAYLPTGDTFAGYAFSPTSGLTWALESIEDHGSNVTFRFRLITRRAGYGEGLFLGGA